MGTRHIIKIIVDGKTKISQYGQWDGYPTGQGDDIAKYIKMGYLDDTFINALRECEWADDE